MATNGVDLSNHLTVLFKQDGLLKLPDICQMQLDVLLFRHHRKMLSKRFDEQMHDYETRTKNTYRSLICRCNTCLHSAMVHGPKLWNSLPEKLRLDSLGAFKILK